MKSVSWRSVLLASIPCFLGIFVAVRYLGVMAEPGSSTRPFTDAITYQAAGERLNSGHELYALGPGDRPVLIIVEISPSPLLSPPPIAVLWRPIAALPFGFALWVAACWAAVLGSTFYLVLRTGLLGAVFACALAPAIGEQLAAGNVASFFPLLLVVAWRHRGRPTAGVLIGLMISVKLAPATLGGWLVGSRQWSAVAAAVIAVAMVVLVSMLGSSPSAFADYVGIALATRPSPGSLSGLTGTAWLSTAVLVGGATASMLVGRWPRASFVLAVIASILGTPALYGSGWVALLAIMAPFADGPAARPMST